MTVQSNPIPVEAARELAERFGKNQVIVVSYDEFVIGVTTFGTTVALKTVAAACGDQIVAMLNNSKHSAQHSRTDYRHRTAGEQAELVDRLMALIRNAQHLIAELHADRYTVPQSCLAAALQDLAAAQELA